MESRKTGLTNLFAVQRWRHRHRKQTYGHGKWGGKERVGCMKRVTGKDVTVCKIDVLNLSVVSDSLQPHGL